ncbi:fatty acyl-AMP ligase [Streptomyces sp. NPDC006660]|uniref:fatty acyl-AMP ligase n=1 Tax=Streptomyces sp. NPDC006660 TaxID=3156901 RepID=UPI0033D8D59D
MSSFAHCLREQAERLGDKRWFAFVDHRGDAMVETGRITFAELDRRARSLALRLGEEGVTDQAVLLLYPAGLPFLSAFFGCLYARSIAVPAPLPATDPRALERAEKIIQDTGARLILTDSAHVDALRRWLGTVGRAGTVECLATDTAQLPSGDAWVPPAVDEGTTAYVQYTSGSTGEPRGVVVSHGNLLHNSAAINTVIRSPESGSGAGWLPHYHDMGLVGQLLQPVYGGGNMVFTSPITFVARPLIWLRMIDEYRAAFTMAPNFAYEWLLRGTRDEDLKKLDISCLQWALNGAEPVRVSTLRKVVDRLGPIGFAPRAWAPAYGMAESTVLVTGSPRGLGPCVRRLDPAALERHEAVAAQLGAPGVELASSGRPVGADLRIVDPGSRTQLPAGRVGEIWVAGPSVAQGYWRQETATRDTFGARLDDGTGPFLRTGDLGFLLDDELFVTGRLKEMIILNGRNLYPQDIEEAGRDAHAATGAAAAFGVDTGREHVVLVQEADAKKLDGLSYAELGARVKKSVKAAAGAPVSLFLVARNTVPRTTSGKIQRARTREDLLAGRIDPLYVDAHPEIRACLPAPSAPSTPSTPSTASG